MGALNGFLFTTRTPPPRQKVDCRQCGLSGYWKMTAKGWRIHEVGKTGGYVIHFCKRKP